MDKPTQLEELLELKNDLEILCTKIEDINNSKKTSESRYSYLKKQFADISWYASHIAWITNHLKENKYYTSLSLSKKQSSIEKLSRKIDAHSSENADGCFYLLCIFIIAPFLLVGIFIGNDGNWMPFFIFFIIASIFSSIYLAIRWSKRRHIAKILQDHYKDIRYLQYVMENEYLKIKNLPSPDSKT
ncbi:MAG: hypothetical protein GY810_20800 [Aureispira sp.]|nr:hypothetical protein [Aureispira sp.]